MDFRKASLVLYFVFFLHLQHHFTHSTSRSTTRLASVEPNHDNPPLQELQSKPYGDESTGNSKELTVVINKGSFGGGGRGFGGGGRSFGGGGRSFGGRGGRRGGGGIHPILIYGGGSHRGGHRSSGGRKLLAVG